MINNYLNVSFKSIQNGDETLNEANVVTIVSSKDHLKKTDYTKNALDKIEKALDKNKTAVFTVSEEKGTTVVVSPNKDLESLRLAGATLYKFLKEEQLKSVFLTGLLELTDKESYAFLEGIILSSYEFTKYKKSKENFTIKIFIATDSISAERLTELEVLGKGVALTKTLVNEPSNFMDALKFAEMAKQAAKEFGFDAKVLHKEEIEALKMGGLLAVNQGSEIPPTFNILEYQPEKAVNSQPLVLVGKGVMFDTGGYSLKVGGSMPTMKSDMAGGAAVLGIISAIAGNKLPYHVIGLVPATDNKISSNALVVDDVITMMDGTTVEVLNTDAEGRLVLADALHYAKRYNPELVIDMATLTGASAAITGDYGSAVLGNQQDKIEALKQVGEEVYERLIQLPLWKEYSELLDSKIADMTNLGGPIGGVSTSSAFLEHFTDYPWIHLDIAGAAHIKEAKGYRQSGGTAVPVRLVYAFVKQLINEQKQ